MGTSQVEDAHLTQHEHSVKSYYVIFVVLMVLLVLTIAAAFMDFGHPGLNLLIAASIATAKAVLIIMYFMHVKGGPRRVIIFAVAGFLWLGILVALTLADYMTRNDPRYPNPKGEPRYVHYPGTTPSQPSTTVGERTGGFYGPSEPPARQHMETEATP
jgi:cytochrome c oxidase subunit IV